MKRFLFALMAVLPLLILAGCGDEWAGIDNHIALIGQSGDQAGYAGIRKLKRLPITHIEVGKTGHFLELAAASLIKTEPLGRVQVSGSCNTLDQVEQ